MTIFPITNADVRRLLGFPEPVPHGPSTILLQGTGEWSVRSCVSAAFQPKPASPPQPDRSLHPPLLTRTRPRPPPGQRRGRRTARRPWRAPGGDRAGKGKSCCDASACPRRRTVLGARSGCEGQATAPVLRGPRRRSSDVGSDQCRSSTANTSGWTLALAIAQFVSAANCLRRNSSGAAQYQRH